MIDEQVVQTVVAMMTEEMDGLDEELLRHLITCEADPSSMTKAEHVTLGAFARVASGSGMSVPSFCLGFASAKAWYTREEKE